MKLIVVRHGATPKKRREDGYCLLNGAEGNVHLKGYDVVNEFSNELRTQLIDKGAQLSVDHPKIDAVFCSALFRTEETVRGIVMGLSNAGASINFSNPLYSDRPIIDSNLNERDYGFIASSISHGIYNDELYLKELEKEEALDGINVDALKSLFPEVCGDLNSSDPLDYLKRITTYDGKGLPRIAPLTSFSDLSKIGVEPTYKVRERLSTFEDMLLENFNKGDTILVGSHGDVLSSWLQLIEIDDGARYSDKTHQTLQERDRGLPGPGYGGLHYRTFGHLDHFVIGLK
jgi:broad specificity phosphatase PhoE